MWKVGMAKTSAGRVQSVALRILSDREKKIQDFVPEEYWKISTLFKNKINSSLEKKNSKKLGRLNKSDAVSIEKDLKSKLSSPSKTKNLSTTLTEAISNAEIKGNKIHNSIYLSPLVLTKISKNQRKNFLLLGF